MSEPLNPHYSADQLGLETITFDCPNQDYSYDTLLFARLKNPPGGSVYHAHDSGCSCPTPFEEYQAETGDAVLGKMQFLSHYGQAFDIIDAWINEEAARKGIFREQIDALETWFTGKKEHPENVRSYLEAYDEDN